MVILGQVVRLNMNKFVITAANKGMFYFIPFFYIFIIKGLKEVNLFPLVY